MITPRPYLSFSQMTTFEMSPQKYADQYLYGKKMRISRNMAYGAKLAEGLENEEANGDPLLDLMASHLPKFKRMDKAVEDPKGVLTVIKRGDSKAFKAHLPVLGEKKEQIPILALPDTAKPNYSAFKEYKTSVRKWTQKMVDESGQITFYATAIWLAKGIIPKDIELVSIETAYEESGKLTVTGEMAIIPTIRTMADIIKMTRRMRNAWHGIKELCEKELI